MQREQEEKERIEEADKRKKQEEEAGVEKDRFALEEERDRSVHLGASDLVLLVFQCKACIGRLAGVYMDLMLPNSAVMHCNIVWKWNWNHLELNLMEMRKL
jgi:hypothetical protein